MEGQPSRLRFVDAELAMGRKHLSGEGRSPEEREQLQPLLFLVDQNACDLASQADSPAQFCMGVRDFDPEHVGFRVLAFLMRLTPQTKTPPFAAGSSLGGESLTGSRVELGDQAGIRSSTSCGSRST